MRESARVPPAARRRPSPSDVSDELFARGVIRFNSVLLGVILGLLAAGTLFIATIWLVLLGGEHPGRHLSLLGVYFPGYDVTPFGAFVGIPYAFVCGFLAGWFVAWAYNRIVLWRHRDTW
jgi:hypothetical protein